MSNPPGPDHNSEPADQVNLGPEATTEQDLQEPATGPGAATGGAPDTPAETDVTEQVPAAESEPATEVFAPVAEPGGDVPAERRYTAPSGFDGSTQQIGTPPPDPATEVFATPGAPLKPAAPQHIPPREEVQKPAPARRSWGWVVAVLLVIAALVAVAVLATVLLTRGSDAAASQEDRVRATIQNFDAAIQNGDLATLRGITCGVTRDDYVRYDDKAWADTHARVAAAKQYPVIASVDQIVINGDHAEANVTTFMAYAPGTRSTRSFDLEFRDDQWKICQAPQ